MFQCYSLSMRRMLATTIWIVWLGELSAAQGGAVGQIQPDKMASHHFVSGMGFSYEVPRELAILNIKQYDAGVRSLASQQSSTAEGAKSIRCAQPLLIAETEGEFRIIILNAHPQDCVGIQIDERNIADVGSHALGELAKRFDLSKVETGKFTVGTHVFWAMRSEALPKQPNNPIRQMAVLVTPTPQGLVECMLEGHTRADLDALAATHLKFEDGTDTAIIPKDVVAPKSQ